MVENDPSRDAAKARFLDALDKKKNQTSPRKTTGSSRRQAKGAQSSAVDKRFFRRKSGSA